MELNSSQLRRCFALVCFFKAHATRLATLYSDKALVTSCCGAFIAMETRRIWVNAGHVVLNRKRYCAVIVRTSPRHVVSGLSMCVCVCVSKFMRVFRTTPEAALCEDPEWVLARLSNLLTRLTNVWTNYSYSIPLLSCCWHILHLEWYCVCFGGRARKPTIALTEQPRWNC